MNSHIKMGKIITSYISKNSSDYAIMLSGSWGCGKTFFAEKELMIDLKKEASVFYFSLNGLTDVTTIINYIFLHIVDTKGIKKYIKGIDGLTRKISSCIEKSSDKAKMLLGFGSSFLGLFTEFLGKRQLLKSPKKIVILLDDLERLSSSIDVSDLLGQIHTKFVLNRVKVIYIANEKEITDANFKKEKEKYIRRTIAFANDKGAIFKKLLDEASIFSDDYMLCLHEVFSEEQVNLRSIKFCLDCYNDLKKYFETLPKDEYKSPDYMFYSFCRIGKFYQQGNLDKAQLENALLTAFYKSFFDSKEENESPYSKFAGEYGSRIVREKLILDLVFDGTFLEKDVDFVLKKQKNIEDPIFKLVNIKDLETKECIEVIKQVKNNLNNHNYSLLQYNYLRDSFIENAELFKISSKDESISLINNSVFDEKNKDDLEATFKHWNEDPFSKIAKANNNFEEKVIGAYNDYLKEKRKKEIDYFIKMLKTCDNSIILHKFEYRNIFSLIKEFNYVNQIIELPNKNINFFMNYIQVSIFNISNASEFQTGEISALEYLSEECEKKKDSTNKDDIIKIEVLGDLKNLIDNAVKHLKQMI